MDLGFCFQDLGDGGDSFIKSFIEPSGHAYQDAMLEDLVSSHGSGTFGLAEDGGWADDSASTSSYLLGASYPSSSSSSYVGQSAHHHHQPTAYHHHNSQQQQQHSFVASSPSASSSPSGRSSPSSASLMALADYEEAALMGGSGGGGGAPLSSLGGGGSMLTMAMPPLMGLSYFDLQAGSMEMPDALGLYGLGGPFATAALDPLPPPPARARPSASSSHLLGPVKLEQAHHAYHHHQQQQQHGTSSPMFSSSTLAPSKVGAGVPGMWSPPLDEPVKRKRKLGAAARRPPDVSGCASSGSVNGLGAGKTSDPYELPLAVELAGALACHRSVSIKIEERPEAGSGKHSHRQQQQQTAGNRQSEPVELVVERQPPVEVRTRTPSENRNFGVTVRITGRHDSLSIHAVEVRLAYATSREEVNQQILGGKKTVPLKEDGRATFDNLSMREASTKHGEREFCLEFVPLSKEDQPLGSFGTKTSPFYAYSHMKVLARRKSVKLRTLNKSHGSVHGGDKMHVIGQPFIKGPSLSIIFSTPHGDVTALNPEMYSDSVLFFEAPPYPCPAVFSPYSRDHVREVKVMVQVTNDGRTMSNPLEFTYIADKPVHRADF